MPEAIHYNEEDGVIDIRASGTLTTSDWHRDIETVDSLSEKHRCRLVRADISEVEIGPSVIDIFTTTAERLPREFRYALVVDEQHPLLKSVEFFEVASRNRGFEMASFVTREEALAWLRS